MEGGRTERGKISTQAKSSRTAELGGLGEGKMSARETERDSQRPADMPRGGSGLRDRGQSQEGGTVQQCQCQKMDLFQEFFSFIWNHDISRKCLLNHQ